MTGRLLIALSGVVMVVLNATGLYVWWVKWRMRRRPGGPSWRRHSAMQSPARRSAVRCFGDAAAAVEPSLTANFEDHDNALNPMSEAVPGPAVVTPAKEAIRARGRVLFR